MPIVQPEPFKRKVMKPRTRKQWKPNTTCPVCSAQLESDAIKVERLDERGTWFYCKRCGEELLHWRKVNKHPEPKGINISSLFGDAKVNRSRK